LSGTPTSRGGKAGLFRFADQGAEPQSGFRAGDLLAHHAGGSQLGANAELSGELQQVLLKRLVISFLF